MNPHKNIKIKGSNLGMVFPNNGAIIKFPITFKLKINFLLTYTIKGSILNLDHLKKVKTKRCCNTQKMTLKKLEPIFFYYAEKKRSEEASV